MMVAYALFSAIFAFSAICPIKFLQSAFVGAMEKNNIAPEYIEGMLNITSVPMLVVNCCSRSGWRLDWRRHRPESVEETLY